jgi:hypothetical protein
VATSAGKTQRVFKTAWFAKTSSKALISDDELCIAIRQVMLGQCDDLGGGVYKKRLSRNLARSIILAKGGRYWVYAYLFLKKDKVNIDKRDLADLRDLAEAYSKKTDREIGIELKNGKIMEICDGNHGQIQK